MTRSSWLPKGLKLPQWPSGSTQNFGVWTLCQGNSFRFCWNVMWNMCNHARLYRYAGNWHHKLISSAIHNKKATLLIENYRMFYHEIPYDSKILIKILAMWTSWEIFWASNIKVQWILLHYQSVHRWQTMSLHWGFELSVLIVNLHSPQLFTDERTIGTSISKGIYYSVLNKETYFLHHFHSVPFVSRFCL